MNTKNIRGNHNQTQNGTRTITENQTHNTELELLRQLLLWQQCVTDATYEEHVELNGMQVITERYCIPPDL